jgi:phosphoribosyl-ATP pyrophosphohydrolase/phosphoribosyl-AMP cyclohydrolase
MTGEELEIRFDDRGLVPAVVQDAATGQVLMVAWMNAEALQRTRETGQVHFWSRSRQELWHKGATSGNTMVVRDLLVDCDGDTLLLQVDPAGPACHTGNGSCFFRRCGSFDAPPRRPDTGGEQVLHSLFATILDRQANPRPGSYTARLLDIGEDEILKKVGEEAMEVILAAKGQGDERLTSEVADLLYHLLVLLAARELDLADVEAELVHRRR